MKEIQEELRNAFAGIRLKLCYKKPERGELYFSSTYKDWRIATKPFHTPKLVYKKDPYTLWAEETFDSLFRQVIATDLDREDLILKLAAAASSMPHPSRRNP